jgi:hypothetical protein
VPLSFLFLYVSNVYLSPQAKNKPIMGMQMRAFIPGPGVITNNLFPAGSKFKLVENKQ